MKLFGIDTGGDCFRTCVGDIAHFSAGLNHLCSHINREIFSFYLSILSEESFLRQLYAFVASVSY